MNISTRKTIRKYTQQPISDELLNRLLEEASHTQTMGNLQLYSVVVTRSQEAKQALAPFHFNQPMVTQAPVVLTICADFRRVSDWCECRQAVPGYDNMLSFMNAATDALLYTQTFCNLAEERAGHLLSGYHALYACTDSRAVASACTHLPRGNTHRGLARREP